MSTSTESSAGTVATGPRAQVPATPSLRARVRFWFDDAMSSAKALWIALVVLIVGSALVLGLILWVTRISPEGEEPVGFVEAFWRSLETFGVANSSPGWPYRILMTLAVVFNLFLGCVIFVLVWVAADDWFTGLRKGRSKVLATDHTVILNWSPTIFDVISELVVANSSRRRPSIAILANKDKIEMDDEIAERVPNLGNTKIYTRSGDPTDLSDLGIMNLQASRAIVVLSPEIEDGDSDSSVIKSVWAITKDPNRRPEVYKIAAEIRESENVELAQVVGGAGLQAVLVDELLARILVQSVRQAGLSLVYSELLDFEGCEIYTVEQPALAGKTFDFAVMAYESCIPIGLCDEAGVVRLNPPGDTLIQGGDRLVLIAEDDSKIVADPSKAAVNGSALRELTPPRELSVERILMIGWNRRAPLVVRELASFAAPGSLLTIAADAPDIEEKVAALTVPSPNLEVELRRINAIGHGQLDMLDTLSYDHVVVLGYSDDLDPQSADTRTMITLLRLRKIAEQSDRLINVASEMIDIKNRELAEVTRADDFVVSNRLVSLMLAQASENASISAIFRELFDEAGSELYLRPVADYVNIEGPVNFYTVAEGARRRGQVAVGYRRMRGDGGAVVLNPVKTELVKFEESDWIVVLSER